MIVEHRQGSFCEYYKHTLSSALAIMLGSPGENSLMLGNLYINLTSRVFFIFGANNSSWSK